eukprot:6464839-Amphidinium_carterae.2
MSYVAACSSWGNDGRNSSQLLQKSIDVGSGVRTLWAVCANRREGKLRSTEGAMLCAQHPPLAPTIHVQRHGALNVCEINIRSPSFDENCYMRSSSSPLFVVVVMGDSSGAFPCGLACGRLTPTEAGEDGV